MSANGGLLASVDGLRFVVPVRTINAGPSPKYFGYKRGITWLNAVNDQVAGHRADGGARHPRDSLYILDALLNLDGGVKPEMVATDNASYSDMVFGLFKILGYRFSPRFRDLDDQRFWRASCPTLRTVRRTGSGTEPLEAWPATRVNLAKVDHPLAGHAARSPAPWSPTRSAPTTCCACSAATDTPARSGRRSRVRADRQDRCTCWPVVDPVDDTY